MRHSFTANGWETVQREALGHIISNKGHNPNGLNVLLIRNANWAVFSGDSQYEKKGTIFVNGSQFTLFLVGEAKLTKHGDMGWNNWAITGNFDRSDRTVLFHHAAP